MIKTKINNYWPIAILSIISKVIERAVTDLFMAYFILKCLLSVTQHAYLKKPSTISFLAGALNHIVKLDVSEAFNTINHQKLLHKLTNLGLDKNHLHRLDHNLILETKNKIQISHIYWRKCHNLSSPSINSQTLAVRALARAIEPKKFLGAPAMWLI